MEKDNCSNLFCNSLDPDTREILCSSKIRVRLKPKQEVLFTIGEGQTILIDKGHIITIRQRHDGKQKGIEVLNSGDIIGVSQLFNERKKITVTIYAKSHVEGCLFNSGFLESLCLQRPDLSREVLRNVCRRYGDCINHIEHISLDNSTEKILFTLDRVVNVSRKIKNEKKAVPFTHEELALLAGMNRVTATRSLDKLKHTGILINFKDL